MLQLKGIKKYYGTIKALDGVELNIKKGEIFGITGQEGSGKTTLLKMAAGLIKPDIGAVYLNGENLASYPHRSKMQIGYVPQYFQLYGKLRVKEHLDFYAGFYPLEGIKKDRWIWELLSKVQMEHMEDVYVEKLSQGMRRRLCVAQALLSDPHVLVLDEPGNGMDAKARVDFRRLLKDLSRDQKSILISSHMISNLPDFCTSVGILEKGKLILEGKMDVIMQKMKQEQPLFIQLNGEMEEALLVLKENPFVKRIMMADSGISVMFDGDTEEEAGLLQALIEKGVPVYGFNRLAGNFESRYLDMIFEQGRVLECK